MVRLQAFKYELKPNGEQQRQMRRFAGSCRFVYNHAAVRVRGVWRMGAVRPFRETGTHRSDSGASRLSAVGISALIVGRMAHSAQAVAVGQWRGGCQERSPAAPDIRASPLT